MSEAPVIGDSPETPSDSVDELREQYFPRWMDTRPTEVGPDVWHSFYQVPVFSEAECRLVEEITPAFVIASIQLFRSRRDFLDGVQPVRVVRLRPAA
jgi:hypothetical protein